MNTSIRPGIARRFAAAVGVVAIALFGTLAAAGPASAATGVGNITGTQGTLTIHKYERFGANGVTPGNGQEQTGTGTPLNGVTFSIQRVANYDLKTAAGWASVQSIMAPANPVTAATAAGLGAAASVTTTGSGTATATLPFGLYLVTETGTPSSVTEAAAPFLVSVPFATGPTATPSNTWIYDVHVYPKNAVTSLGKSETTTAADIAAGADLARWAITAKVPVLASGTISSFVLTDVIDAAQLAFVTDAAAVALGLPAGTVTAVKADGTTAVALTAGTDYTISPATGTTRTVTFTSTGLTKLSTQAPGGTVTFDVLTRVVGVPANGVITNSATSDVNGKSGNTATATTTFGQLQVFSHVTGTTTPLAGGVYRVKDAAGNTVVVNGVNSWTSDANGLLTVPELRPGNYTLVLVTPSAGYQLPANTQVATTITAGTSDPAAPKNYVDVPYAQVPAWALPLTGGDGALWFGVGGVALVVIAAGAAVLVAARRRRHEAVQA